MTVSGTLYLVSGLYGGQRQTTVTVSLDDCPRIRQYRALLVASLYKCGYITGEFGTSVSFHLSHADTHHSPGIGRAFDAIGRALGGSGYTFHLSDFQEQRSTGDGLGSERFRFRATGVQVGQGSDTEEVDAEVRDYLESKCG